MMTEAVNPNKVKDLAEVESAVARWEEKVDALAGQFGESISDRMKMAIFTSMLPTNVQDYVHAHADRDTKYPEPKEKVRAMIGNKMAASVGQTPMDVGLVDDEIWHDDYGKEVYGVTGQYQCRNCFGYGHFARECPSKGKGGKGGGFEKGFGKGMKGGLTVDNKGGNGGGFEKGFGKYGIMSGKGAMGMMKGKGKGYQGTCWRCN